MMINEFSARTGFNPTAAEYQDIEKEYYEFNGDKDEFCRMLVEKGKIVELINKRAVKISALENELAECKKNYQNEVMRLTAIIEKEQEWSPYIDNDNVHSSDYSKLTSSAGTELLSDDEAKALICEWFGFDCEKITILHSVPIYEVNRHRQLRKVGEKGREPVYNASDWNYIRFDCGCMSYEVWNGILRFFMD